MPELCRMGSLVMQMWLDDHPGPHFHAHHDGQSISVYIRTLEVEDAGGFHPKKKRIALKWARKRRSELLIAWERVERHQLPGKIPPL